MSVPSRKIAPRIAAAIIACGTLGSCRPSFADYTVTVDPGVHYQTISGWGTSLCWWGKVIGSFPEPARSDYINKIFDPVQGLGLNIVRYNIGGGENPSYLSPNKQFLSFRTNIPGFEPSPGVWDWNADADQRYVLKQAIAKGANIVQAFSNSPPYWMTVSGSVTGSHSGTDDNLDPAHYQDFADYLITVSKHFKTSWGITFKTLEPLNEPDGNWWRFGGRQEGCAFSNTSANGILKIVGQSLKASKLKTALAAADDNNIDNAVQSYKSCDGETQALIQQIDTHAYGGSNREELRQLAISGGKTLWMSEYGDNDGTGLKMSDTILRDMKEMRCTAWVTWQAVDGGGWGLLDNPEKDSTTTAYTAKQKYYVLGQYSKFIRPGDVIIGDDDSHSLCAWDAHSKKVIIVTTNDLPFSENVSYDLTKFSGAASATPYQTSESPQQDLAKYKDIPVTGGHFSFQLPPSSVTTFVVSGVKSVSY